QGEGPGRSRGSDGSPDAHGHDAGRSVSPHSFCRAARRRRTGIDPCERAAGWSEPVHQQWDQRVLLPPAQRAARAGPRSRAGGRARRARSRDGAGGLRPGTPDVDAPGAHGRALHHASRSGGHARERGGPLAIRTRRRAGDRGLPPRTGERAVKALRTLFLILSFAGRTQAQVDPSSNWRTLHTPHFRIHFLPSYRSVALVEAREAERSYRLLATELHPPRGVVDITLADDIDASNGFTS